MRPAAIADRLPRFLRNHILHFEWCIQGAVERLASQLPAGTRVLDAGAGEGRYAEYFRNQRYCGVDLGIGDSSWNYRGLDAIADLAALPFRNGCFEVCLNIVTLEHVRQPECVLSEISRALAP